MERLQKVLAQAGVASRRASEELINQGVVSVNGITIKEQGFQVSPKDVVCVNGIPIIKEENVYYALNKPTGYVSTLNDELGRKTVMDLFSKNDLEKRIYPVGRLDYNTAGLILVTNDGEFANKLTSPRSDVEKEYLARIDNFIHPDDLRKLEKGVVLNTGYKTKKCFAKVVSYDKKNNSSSVKIVITEGKNHQVRLMFESLGFSVKKLTRVRFGEITLENIPRGSYRPLKIHEIKRLISGVRNDE